MGISLIPNQQIVFDQSQDPCNNVDTRDYCQLIQNSDNLYFQFKQSPCGFILNCNSGLETTFGVERVTNGDFTTNSSGWTLSGGASYDASHAIKMSGGTAPDLTQTSISGIVNGTVYAVGFDVIDYVNGTLDIDLLGYTDSFTPQDQRYTFLVTASTDDIDFTAGVLGYVNPNFLIDNVSIKEVTFTCWDYSNTNIVLTGGGVCHIEGVSTDIIQSNILIPNLYYKFEVILSNRTQGSVQVIAGTNVISTITSNGSQVVYGQSDGTDLTLRMSDDYDGCIEFASVFLIRTDFQATLKDLDGNFVADLNALVQPSLFPIIEAGENEYITFIIPFEAGNIIDYNGDPVPYGCYKVCIYDPCRSSIENDNIWESAISWTPSDPDIIHGTVTNDDGWLMTATGNGDGTAQIITSGSTSTH